MNENTLFGTVLGCAILAILWSLYHTIKVLSVKVVEYSSSKDKEGLLEPSNIQSVQKIGKLISDGADSFLSKEYTIMTYFIIIFSFIVFFLVDYDAGHKLTFYATFSFILGSLTSMLCGYIGMKIAVAANYRTTYLATKSLEEAFRLSYRAGCVMGFSTVGIALVNLAILLYVYQRMYLPGSEGKTYSLLMELIAGYGLGGSSMALFGRVGGGIYTKAADVGADLAGKIDNDIPEDDPRNPATIADNVGDNVGDVAGMGSDLFGSFAESTCAALVIMSHNKSLMKTPYSLYFPLLISCAGIIGCFVVSVYGIYLYKVNTFQKIQKCINQQMYLSSFLTLALLYPTIQALPKEWNSLDFLGEETQVHRLYAYICTGSGLISGLIIGIVTDYYTSYEYSPVREMAKSCSYGAAINVIQGLSLGFLSTGIPILCIAINLLITINLLDLFGVALSAIGMLSILSISLAIDAFGPICDNAGGIAEMCQLGEEVRNKTDALDACGNTTAAVGKGFAIGSAALVSVALYGAFITRGEDEGNEHPFYIKDINLRNPWIFSSLLIGAMTPYIFSALTITAVGKAATEMVAEVRRQFLNPKIKEGTISPDYQKCIEVSTKASLKEMILPGILVIFTPLFFGILFHPILIAGLLPGALVSGIQQAISMSNTGGAWDNCKKYIGSGEYKNEDGEVKGKGSEEHKAAIIGDTVGDPLKDTSGPSLNILIKLMAIVSLVFAGSFDKIAFLSKYFKILQQQLVIH